MPAYVTHSLFGSDVEKTIKGGKAAEVISEERIAFEWGLQGPDVLFFRRILGKGSVLNAYGSLMHAEKTDELFTAMTSYVREMKARKDRADDCRRCEAYLLGFYCHYTLDKNVHPYVYYHEARIVQEQPLISHDSAHAMFESDIDSALYYERTYRQIHKFPLSKLLIRDKRMREAVAGYYQTILKEVYGIDVRAQEIFASFVDMYRTIRLLVRHNRISLALARLLDRLCGRRDHLAAHVRKDDVYYDVLNHARRLWEHVGQPKTRSRRTFEALYRDSVEEAASNIADLCEALESGRELAFEGMLSFGNGNPLDAEHRLEIQQKLSRV